MGFININGIEVEDTYAEAFDGLFTRLVVTAKDEKRLKRAVLDSTALPCTVFGETEGGVEKWLPESETPDGRIGAVIQIWINYTEGAKEKLEYDLSKRVRQGILVVPTTTVFNALESKEMIDTMYRIGHCGDGYEFVETYCNREMINIPIMAGEFRIEKELGVEKGVMGGNLWFMCNSIDSALEACDKAEEAIINKVNNVILSFRESCSAGSKAGGRFKHIGPTTNHPYCPTLKGKIDSKVPDGVESIPEIVINGATLEAVKEAMKTAIDSVKNVEGLVKISAGNYGGKLGKHKIFLKELL